MDGARTPSVAEDDGGEMVRLIGFESATETKRGSRSDGGNVGKLDLSSTGGTCSGSRQGPLLPALPSASVVEGTRRRSSMTRRHFSDLR